MVMKQFALLFRQPGLDLSKVSPTEMQALTKKWKEWTERTITEGRVVNQGLRLATEGRVLKPSGVVTDGPFVEIREILGGLMVVNAEDLEEATTIAHGCPVLDRGGSVEIRPLFVE